MTPSQIMAADIARLEADIAAIRRGERPAWLDEIEEGEDLEDEFESPERETFGRFCAGPRPNEFADILKRPVDEILALIARELGLPPQWLSEAEEAWEREQADLRRPAPLHASWPASCRPPMNTVGDSVSTRMGRRDKPGDDGI